MAKPQYVDKAPERWIETPRIGDIIINLFIPFKAPLYTNLPYANRWNPRIINDLCTVMDYNLGAVVDLTKTDRYYNSSEFSNRGIEYKKIECLGRGQSPDESNISDFISFCDRFTKTFPGKRIGVHCTHGYNRTGFLICCYLIRRFGFTVDNALETFKKARPPGILKPEYISDLRKPKTDATPNNMLQVISKMCNFHGKGFPGAHPVSMTKENINLLKNHYYVSWKADGERLMMFVVNKNDIYLLDRTANIKKSNVIFPTKGNIFNTLLDGEMVVDDNKSVYLIYDIIHLNKHNTGQENYDVRYRTASKIVDRRIDQSGNSFRIAVKPFDPIRKTSFYLSDTFMKNIKHQTDGLIFQPIYHKYKGGRDPHLLKWKPAHLNTIDFRLKLTDKGGALFVEGSECPFGYLDPNGKVGVGYPDWKALDNKIVECTYNTNGSFSILRTREDKQHPNSLATANGVMKSIKDNVTQKDLLEYVKKLHPSLPNTRKGQSINIPELDNLEIKI